VPTNSIFGNAAGRHTLKSDEQGGAAGNGTPGGKNGKSNYRAVS